MFQEFDMTESTVSFATYMLEVHRFEIEHFYEKTWLLNDKIIFVILFVAFIIMMMMMMLIIIIIIIIYNKIFIYFVFNNIIGTRKEIKTDSFISEILKHLESIYLYFPPSSQLLYLCFCPVGLSLL